MRIQKPRKSSSVLGLTSLIDVIFLLLLFFMLSSTFSKFSILNLGVATLGSTGKSEAKLILRLESSDRIYVNGKAVSRQDLRQTLSQFVAKGADKAVVMTRGEVDVQQLVSFLADLKTSPLVSVTLAP